jgi:O-antigen/teichoic acid export membrane protein
LKSLLRQLQGDGLKAQMLKGAGGSAGLQAVNLVLTLISGVLLARALGPENYGIYAFVLSVITLLSLPAKAGLPTLLIREIAKNQLSQKWGLMRGLLRLSNRFALGYSLMAVAVAAICLFWFSGGGQSAQAETFYWALLLLPLMAFDAVRAGTLRGLRLVLRAQLPEQIVRPLVLIILVGTLLLFGTELTPIIAIQFNLAGAFTAFILGSLLLIKSFPQNAVSAKAEYTIRPWAASLLPLSLFAGLKLLDSQISILFLGFLGTKEEVGLFRVAATGAALVSFGLQAVNMALAPQVARLYGAGETEKLQKLVTLSTRVAVAVSVPVAFVLMAWGEEIIALIFGDEYIPAAKALIILCLGQLVNASAGSVALILNMTGNDKSTVLGAATALVVNFMLAIILIPLLGLSGAAIGFAVSLTIWNVILMVMVKKKVGITTFLVLNDR